MTTFNGLLTVGKEPTLSTLTNNGDEVLNFSAAYNLYAGKDQEAVTQWLDVKVFKPNEYLKTNIQKGVTLFAQGQLGAKRWTDKGGVAQVSMTLTISFPQGGVGIQRVPASGGNRYTPTQPF